VIRFPARSAEEALRRFLFHVQHVADSEWGHYYLGAIYQERGMAEKAREEFELCLKYAAMRNNEYAIQTVKRLLCE
jgi:hypothetical protein